MSVVSKDDIYKLANLGGISLSDQEVLDLQPEISRILEYVNQLDELDVSGVEPTYQGTNLKNVWRDDKIASKELDSQILLNLSPDKNQQQLKVPKVL